MRISGFLKNTFVDYPGKVASTIFISGCNFHCGFCHNPEMVGLSGDTVDQAEMFDYLERATRKNFIDGVCITGGEPTLYGDKLIQLICELKNLGLQIKLDTNGSNPEMLRELDVDYIAMDLKTSLARYGELSQLPNLPEKIEESINYLQQSGIDSEFRTTLVPGLIEEEEIDSLGALLKPETNWFFQNFRNDVVYDPYFLTVQPHSLDRVQELVKHASKHCNAILR